VTNGKVGCSGIAEKRGGSLRGRVRDGYELPLSSATHFVPRFLGELFLSYMVRWLNSARVNSSIVSTTSGMCERLSTSL
jgi:hypothetical protein